MNYCVEVDGFAFVRGILDEETRRALVEELGPVQGAGRRGMLAVPCVAALARSAKMIDLVRPFLAANPRPVRGIYFDKSPDTNWLVAWHQDLTLALREKVETPGFESWSVKNGVPHVRPPLEYLERMLTVRLHLDNTDESNGALRVRPGSHRLGRLSPIEISELNATSLETACNLNAGDAMLMRPLLVHASGRSTSHRRRRILHIEYAGFHLPPTLAWSEA